MCRGVVSFERDLRDASDPQARIQCIERFLLANLRRPALDEEMVRSATTIMEAKGSRRVQELADALSMSRRQYLRRFQDTMGVDPSLFTQLVRFQSTFEAMDLHGEAPDWPAIALDAGYYDQAHFINAFRSFTGLSPRNTSCGCAARRSGSTSMRTARTMIPCGACTSDRTSPYRSLDDSCT
ncbi:MAG: AraC family transcriptional regulator [Flavobacteriales bacterium]|nr:AraC family transcriptional regulator [Flavobacteriales bacterium]